MAKVCENCGATYIESDGYCKNCWKKVTDDIVKIKGLPKTEWEKFIGKKSDRYTKIFEKNEDKKVFFELNIAAFLFGFVWMFYRKMYKYAFVYMLITTLFTLAVYGGVYGIYKNDIVLYQKLKVQHDEYYRNEYLYEDELEYNEAGEIIGVKEKEYPQFLKDYNKLDKKLRFWPAFLIRVLPFALSVFLSLLADCAYREHIYQKLRAKQSGGTSKMMIFVAMAINIALSVATTPILEKFTNFFEFKIFGIF